MKEVNFSSWSKFLNQKDPLRAGFTQRNSKFYLLFVQREMNNLGICMGQHPFGHSSFYNIKCCFVLRFSFGVVLTLRWAFASVFSAVITGFSMPLSVHLCVTGQIQWHSHIWKKRSYCKRTNLLGKHRLPKCWLRSQGVRKWETKPI